MPKYKPNDAGTEGLDRIQRLEKHVADSPTLTPSSSLDNVIQPTAAGTVPLVLKAAAGQTADLLQIQDQSGAVIGGFSATGGLNGGSQTAAQRKVSNARTVIYPRALGQRAMASPPTVSAATNGATTISSPVTVLKTDARITYRGGVPVARSSGAYYENQSTSSTSDYQQNWSEEFIHDGQKIDILFGAVSAAGGFRIKVNDEYVSLTVTALTANDGGQYRVPVDFGSRGVRKIEVEDFGNAFGGITIEATGQIYAVRNRAVRAVFLGDSLTFGSNATQRLYSWTQVASAILGWDEPFPVGEAGTGYLDPGTGGSRSTFASRIAADVYARSPDVIVVWGGINDRPVNNAAYTPAALQAAASALYSDIAASCPVSPLTGAAPLLFVLGCWQPTGSPSSDMTNANAAIQAAALAASNVTAFVDPTGWITGTGKAGATTGTGNADFCISSDGLHPNDEGHALIGRLFAEAVAFNV